MIRNGGTEAVVPLRSRGWLGLFAYLVNARLGDARDGYRTDAEIHAEAPGWGGVKKVRSVGKKISDITGRYEVVRPIIAAPNGITLPPWRIEVDPSSIVLADPKALHELLQERASLPAEHETRRAGRSLSIADLAEIEETITRGATTEGAARRIRTTLDDALSSREPLLRAEAARLDAMLLRRKGSLSTAKRRIDDALAWLSEHQDEELLRYAAALNEAGVIAYRGGELVEADRYFREERTALAPLTGDAAHRGRARCFHSLAHVALRRKQHAVAIELARSAATSAEASRDRVGKLLAQAVECRIIAHRGGISDATEAADRLERLANLVPVTDPEAVLMVRRLLLEALYLVEDEDTADKLAESIVRDAMHLGYARELDHVVWLLQYFKRREAIAALPKGVRRAKRDRVEDWDIIKTGRVVVGRRTAWSGAPKT